jgi:predicted MFS family arabinose efflux permease
MALAADLTRPERRSVIMAVIGVGIGASFLLSMMLSVPLATLLGLGGLFWLTVAFAVIGMMLVMTVPAVPSHMEQPLEKEVSDMRPVWLLAISVFLLHAVMTLLFVSFPPMLVERFGLALPAHWKIYVPTMLLSVVFVFPLLRRIGASLSEHRCLPWAFLALGAAMMTIPFSSPWLLLGALVVLYFSGFNLLEAAMPSVLSRITGSRGRGRKMGLYSSFQFVGAFVGGAAGGWLLAGPGSEVALVSAGAVCLLWGIVMKLLLSGLFPTRAPA